jgi:hypothetical protein
MQKNATVALTLVLVLVLALACRPFAEKPDPAAVVNRFYTAYQALGPGLGLPAPADLAKLAPLLTPRLRALLAAARRVQDDFAKAHPDEKPPFVEGDLFSSLFEGFKAFHVGAAEPLPGGGYRVKVDLSYWEESDPKTVTKWQDAVLVQSQEGALLIDDFEFLGDWDFAQKGRLSEILRAEP